MEKSRKPCVFKGKHKVPESFILVAILTFM